MGKDFAYDRITKEFEESFKKALKNAKLTGQLLAISLVLGYPFSTQTISLVGYSLGTQVIKSCLQTLSRLEAHDLIHNVSFIAGATHFEKDQ